MKTTALGFLAILVLLLGSTTAIRAQYKDNMGGNWNNPTSASIGNILNDRLWNRLRAKARARKAGSTTANSNATANTAPPSVAPDATINEAAVKFRSTGTQLKTRAIADELMENGSAAEKNQIFQILSTLLTEYEKAARAAGKPNDMALAITAALVYNSSIYNGTPEPDDARIMEIRDALAELMVEGGTMSSLNDRQKQELYETMVIFTMLAKSGYEEAKKNGDANTAEIYRRLAGQTLQAVSGMPPEQINLSRLNVGSTGSSEDTTAESTQSPAAPAIEHWVILREYRDNQIAASARYEGKRVTIVGAIDFIMVENGQPVIRMSVPAWSALQMFCIFPVSQKPALAKLAVNQRVMMECTVKGEVGGLDNVGRITLDRCSLK
ncbi:MAG: hypothetical protein QOF61_2032 [Acidobacteriota bacterium]|nr:hypothetical protein [Acidobacteriota bacterium]